MIIPDFMQSYEKKRKNPNLCVTLQQNFKYGTRARISFAQEIIPGVDSG
jgi:hypothetical protein